MRPLSKRLRDHVVPQTNWDHWHGTPRTYYITEEQIKKIEKMEEELAKLKSDSECPT